MWVIESFTGRVPFAKHIGDKEAPGASIYYLPAYSPDPNPIEQFLAKLKLTLRRTTARTVTSLWTAITACLKTVFKRELAEYLANSWYG